MDGTLRGTFTAHLQLIRLPNVFTAAADSLAGWLLVGGSLGDPGRWGPLAVASMLLYAAGTALNDAFDMEIDRVERPSRPLPSGRVSHRTAALLGGMGLGLGPALALASGSPIACFVAGVLALFIFTYDIEVKRTYLGPVFMGACRGLNLLLGMAAAPDLGGPAAWSAAAAYGVFVAGITVISRSETHEGERQGLVAGVAILDIALIGLAAVAMAHCRFPERTGGGPASPVVGVLVIGLIVVLVNRAALLALREPNPGTIQRTVKTGILSLVWLNVGLVAAVRGIEPAAAVAILWVPAFLLGRWLYST